MSDIVPLSEWLDSLDGSVRGKVIEKITEVDMGARKSSKKLKTWSSLKQERFKNNPNEAVEYLKAALEENGDRPDLVIEAIRGVSEALGLSIEQIAKRSNKTPSTIHKALGKKGNPTLGTLTAVLKTMGLKLSVEKAS